MKLISKEMSNLLKGIAILVIVIHNFYHILPPKLGENEFFFNKNLMFIYFDALLNSPGQLLKYIFSYFGHYPVSIFIFLSAFGLSKSINFNKTTYFEFLIKRTQKIYIATLISFAIYLILGFFKSAIQNTPELIWYDSHSFVFIELALKLALISNLIEGSAVSVVGPWWFIPFIIQLYIFFPLIYKIFDKFEGAGLLVLFIFGVFLEAFLWPLLFNININLNFLGHLPTICFGIYCSKQKKIGSALLPVAIITFVLGNFYYYLWILSNVSFVIILILLIRNIEPMFPLMLRRGLSSIGELSLYIFLLNGFVRLPLYSLLPFLDYLSKNTAELLVCLLCIFISSGLALVCSRINLNFKKIRK